MKAIKDFFIFIKSFPIGFIILTFANIICLITDNYNIDYNINNVITFISMEIMILIIYLMLYIGIKRY